MKFYKAMKLVVIGGLILAFMVPELQAQAGRGKGRLKGIVIDEQGNHVANANVEIIWHRRERKDKDVKRETKTNDKGRFVFMNLGYGNWEIFVEARGYKPAQKMALVSELSNNPTVKIVMKKRAQVVAKKKLKESVSLVDKANQLFAEAKFAEAQELYEKFLEKQPDFYQTHLYIGNCHKEKGEYDQAMAQFRKALEKAPADGDPKDIQEKAKIQAAIGDLYIRKNDLKAAQEYFQKSLDLSPKDEILAYNVGEIFFSNNKTQEAIHYFKLAASIKPDWADPHLKLGYTYLNSGDYKSAIGSFNKFLELAPDSDQAESIKEVIKSLKDM